jgi:hypothetical protein
MVDQSPPSRVRGDRRTLPLPAPWPSGWRRWRRDPGESGVSNVERREAIMDQPILPLLIRERLADGRLSHDRFPRVWGGPGNGETCYGCGETVTKGQRAMEGLDPKGRGVRVLSRHFHVGGRAQPPGLVGGTAAGHGAPLQCAYFVVFHGGSISRPGGREELPAAHRPRRAGAKPARAAPVGPGDTWPATGAGCGRRRRRPPPQRTPRRPARAASMPA